MASKSKSQKKHNSKAKSRSNKKSKISSKSKELEKHIEKFGKNSEKKNSEFLKLFLDKKKDEIIKTILYELFEIMGVIKKKFLKKKEYDEKREKKLEKILIIDNIKKPTKSRKKRFENFQKFFFFLTEKIFKKMKIPKNSQKTQISQKLKKIKKLEKIFSELINWLISLSKTKIREIRIQICFFLTKIIKKLQNFNDSNFLNKLIEKLISKYLLPRINDVEIQIKKDIINFMKESIDINPNLLLKNEDEKSINENFYKATINKLTDSNSEIRISALEYILKSLSVNDEDKKMFFLEILKKTKEIIFSRILNCTNKEIIFFVKLLEKMIENECLEDDDFLRIGLISLQPNQKISKNLVEMLQRYYNLDGFFKNGKIEEILFNDFLKFLIDVTHKRYEKFNKKDFVFISNIFLEGFDFDKFGEIILNYIFVLISKKNIEIKSKFFICGIINFLTAISLKKKNEKFLQNILKMNFCDYIQKFKKINENCVEAFIFLYQNELEDEESPEFKENISKINKILIHAKSEKIIKTIFDLFSECQKTLKTEYIQNLLKTKYETYKKEFSIKMENLKDDDLNEEIKILLMKIKNINRIFFGNEKLASDFPLIKNILNKYTTEKYKYDAYNIIKLCLLIQYQNFQFYYTKLFKSDDFNNNIREFIKERDYLIELFNVFLQFKMNKFEMETSQQNLIRIEAFNLLLNIYSMLCSNKVSHIFFLYFKPKEEMITNLLKFINQNISKDNKIQIMDSNKKNLIQHTINNSFEESQKENENSFLNSKKSFDAEIEENGVNEEGEGFLFQNEMSQFVCSKITDFLIKCSQSNFGRCCIHKIVNLFFFDSKFVTYNFKSILYSFLKKILENDENNLEYMNFWGTFFKVILLLEKNEKKIFEITKFFFKIFDANIIKKKINELGKKKIFDGFLRMTIILYTEALNNHKRFYIKLIEKVFIKKHRFKNEEEKLKILFYKLCKDFKEEIEKLETIDREKIEELHGKIARLLDFNKKPNFNKKKNEENTENIYIGNLNEKQNNKIHEDNDEEIEEENMNVNSNDLNKKKNEDRRKNKKKGKKKFEEKYEDDRHVRDMEIKKKII